MRFDSYLDYNLISYSIYRKSGIDLIIIVRCYEYCIIYHINYKSIIKIQFYNIKYSYYKAVLQHNNYIFMEEIMF